ncbi:Zinc finger, RING-CH-type [Sesbania bispinosa]|nr:Zinc finger, RING-CH-type [Sesbania bispinosa]
MEMNNMENHAIVSTNVFMGTPSQGSSSTQHPHIAIPIDELTGAMEDAKENKNLTDSKDNDKKTEETGECRYCQEEEPVFKLETPCGCTGSLKFAHRKCISQWCDRKGNITCELCKQPYHPNYVVTVPHFYYHDHDDEEIDMRQ